jgi:hypothetical protein
MKKLTFEEKLNFLVEHFKFPYQYRSPLALIDEIHNNYETSNILRKLYMKNSKEADILYISIVYEEIINNT